MNKPRKHWLAILKQGLVAHPARSTKDKLYRREHRNDYFATKNTSVIIKTVRKRYEFGGPEFISNPEISLGDHAIKLTRLDSKPSVILWEKIREIDLHFFLK